MDEQSADGWRWVSLDGDGTQLPEDETTANRFPTQSDAESYLGEHWEEFAEAGAQSVTLLDGDSVVYGPMSLLPAD